jgi:hypothetical protein
MIREVPDYGRNSHRKQTTLSQVLNQHIIINGAPMAIMLLSCIIISHRNPVGIPTSAVEVVSACSAASKTQRRTHVTMVFLGAKIVAYASLLFAIGTI